MADTSAMVKMALQVVGISVASALAGASAAQSIIATPALLKAPPTMIVKQFDAMTLASMGLLKPASMGSALIFSILAYLSHTPSKDVALTTNTQWKLFATASLAAFAVIPYMIVTLAPIGHKMEDVVAKVNAESGEGTLTTGEEQEVMATLAKWTEVNKGRAVIPLVGSVVALVASLAY